MKMWHYYVIRGQIMHPILLSEPLLAHCKS